MPSLRYEDPAWEAQTANLISKAEQQSPVEVPWTAEEDGVLVRLLMRYTDIQEWQMKMATAFDPVCQQFGVARPTKREYLDIIKRLLDLKREHRKMDIVLKNSKDWLSYRCPGDLPLWEDKSEASSSSRVAGAASHSNEDEGGESESDEDEVVEVVRVRKKKKAKVVEVEESEDDEEEEEIAEEEAHNGQQHHVEAGGASQQQNTQPNAAAASSSQGESSRGTKREPTLLLEAGGKRIRIGIPPKGTKVKCYPEHGSIELKF